MKILKYSKTLKQQDLRTRNFINYNARNLLKYKSVSRFFSNVVEEDDFGYYDTSVMGSKYYETPNIDNIANQGMNFTNGYANCQVCSPSRASILTGKNTARHGITDWIGAAVGEKWRSKKTFH